jgi:hypothetical protein
LRAAKSVEAAPERTVTRKMARAERPVTARIRERIVDVRHCLDDSRTRWESEPLNLRRCCDVGRVIAAGLGTGWEANHWPWVCPGVATVQDPIEVRTSPFPGIVELAPYVGPPTPDPLADDYVSLSICQALLV